jgi:ribosomal protein L44E
VKLHWNEFECRECGKAILRDDLRTHMVTEHAYQQVGKQVFLRHDCIYCGKPGLYQVGRNGFYCKAHYQEAAKRRAYGIQNFVEPRFGEKEREGKVVEHIQVSRRMLHNVKKYGHP